VPKRMALGAVVSVLGLLALPEAALAAEQPDLVEVAAGTAAAAAGVALFLSLIYGLKVTLGLVKPPPAEEPGEGGHH
jgi:hypothetical protein